MVHHQPAWEPEQNGMWRNTGSPLRTPCPPRSRSLPWLKRDRCGTDAVLNRVLHSPRKGTVLVVLRRSTIRSSVALLRPSNNFNKPWSKTRNLSARKRCLEDNFVCQTATDSHKTGKTVSNDIKKINNKREFFGTYNQIEADDVRVL